MAGQIRSSQKLWEISSLTRKQRTEIVDRSSVVYKEEHETAQPYQFLDLQDSVLRGMHLSTAISII
ncbi:hypothetical protein CHS0354_041375 [Potamilus streckersoni]|uniref:Uncharacterized protein n=1 Tax=Potamilus streckersoni TaxID=2493646 RepID=A0AAE0W9W5_9BIVA|nr:hypothetical protein CHS0354_041375 [Potamilus streckersoni]